MLIRNLHKSRESHKALLQQSLAQQNILQQQYNAMREGHSSSINPYGSLPGHAPKVVHNL